MKMCWSAAQKHYPRLLIPKMKRHGLAWLTVLRPYFWKKVKRVHFLLKRPFFSTEGKYVDAFTTQGVFPPTQEQLDTIGYHLVGDETLMKELAYNKYKHMLAHLLPTEEDRKSITWIIPHQVNRKLITQVLQEHHMMNKTIIWDADLIGNIGGASILYSLARAVEEKIFDRSGKILLMSVGGGLSYAGQILQFHTN